MQLQRFTTRKRTVEGHQGQSATPNAMTENVYDNESTPRPVNTILITGDSTINGIDEKETLKEKFKCES